MLDLIGRNIFGKVVNMSDRRGGAAGHPALAQLRGYWEALRADGELPTRAMIDPRGIERALEHSFVAERVAPGVARLRLAGMHLNDLMGMEVRGMPLTALFEPVAREAVAREVERAFAGTAAVELRLEAPRGIGRPALTGTMLLLPLRNELGEVARVLGGLATDGEIGRAPRRFQITGSAHASVTAPATEAATRSAIDTPVPAGAVAPDPVPVEALAEGLAEAPAAFKPERPAAKGAPYLRLVHSSD